MTEPGLASPRWAEEAPRPAGLEIAGQLRSGNTILVTAAAGGTGQFVVQLAKAAGAHVIALCSSSAKAAMLQQLGADRIVNYKSDDLGAILKAEYPKVRPCLV